MFRRYFLPLIVWALYVIFCRSWRIKKIPDPKVSEAVQNGDPVILAHWHGDELAVLHLVKDFKLATMTSNSKDGQLIDFVIKRLGGATSKGSSSKGAIAALKGLIRLVKGGRMASMAVDGPRGPIYKAKPGVFELSRLTGAIIVPVGVATSRKFVSKKSWNKAVLPKLFSRVVIVFGSPLPIVTKDQPTKSIKLAEKLEISLFDARQQAANHLL